jgi:hypothetical protein
MKVRAIAVAWLMPLLLTACFHKTRTSRVPPYAPPLSTVPKPSTTAVELPPSATTIPSQPLASGIHLEPARKAHVKHWKHVDKTAQQTANAAPPAVNSAPPAPAEIPEVSAIGQLSSGDPSDLRRETADLIAATERGLNGLGRTLSDSEQKTAAQIREFLKQASVALASGDVDGAHTLAAKAKVLLGELAGS